MEISKYNKKNNKNYLIFFQDYCMILYVNLKLKIYLGIRGTKNEKNNSVCISNLINSNVICN